MLKCGLYSIKYCTFDLFKKLRWCACDSNPEWQDGRRRRFHWAMPAPRFFAFFFLPIFNPMYMVNVSQRIGNIRWDSNGRSLVLEATLLLPDLESQRGSAIYRAKYCWVNNCSIEGSITNVCQSIHQYT